MNRRGFLGSLVAGLITGRTPIALPGKTAWRHEYGGTVTVSSLAELTVEFEELFSRHHPITDWLARNGGRKR